jgi:uncharacterized membrane protein
MREAIKSVRSRVGRAVRNHFLAGLVVVVPVAATVLILKWVFDAIDGVLAPAVEAAFDRPIAGLGVAAMVLLIYLSGVITTSVLGGRLYRRAESMVSFLPVAKQIYNTMKQVLESVMIPSKGGFKETVLVDFPRPGMKTIAFVTNYFTDGSGRAMVNVYVPTTPNPTSGFLGILPVEEVVSTRMPVDEAIQLIVSGGMVSPASLTDTFGATQHGAS